MGKLENNKQHVKDLSDAIQNLSKKDDTSDADDNTSKSDSGKDDENNAESPATGDNTSLLWMMVVGAAAAFWVLYQKRLDMRKKTF